MSASEQVKTGMMDILKQLDDPNGNATDGLFGLITSASIWLPPVGKEEQNWGTSQQIGFLVGLSQSWVALHTGNVASARIILTALAGSL